MTATLERTASTPEAWRIAATAIFRAGEALIEAGKTAKGSVTEYEDSLTLRQLRFIHGPMLQQISEQARVNGVLYTRDMWKKYLKELFIPDKFVMERAPMVRDRRTGQWRPSKREVPVKVYKSLKDLGVKRCSDFIDKSIAHMSTDWGVEFRFLTDEREAVRYKPARAKAKQVEEAETCN